MSEHLLEVKHLKKSYPVYDNSGNYLQRRNICVRSMICRSLLKKEKLTDW